MVTGVELEGYLKRIADVRVTVFGDFCLDVYWFLDEGEQELSVETGLALRRVRKQRHSLGGAGNVAANLKKLGAKEVRAVGVAGEDIFGLALMDLLRKTGILVEQFHVCSEWQTMVYAKPFHGGVEGNRFDFGAFNQTSTDVEDHLIGCLEQAVAKSDVVVLNQQVPGGVNCPRLLDGINGVIRKNPDVLFLVDSRHFPGHYSGAMLKLNAEEASRLLDEPFDGTLTRTKALEYVSRINARTGKAAFLTRGERGMVLATGGRNATIPGIRISGPVDTVGAGDTVVATLAAALGSGLDAEAAAELANVAATVTVRKLHTTGTASPEEILQAAKGVEFVAEECAA